MTDAELFAKLQEVDARVVQLPNCRPLAVEVPVGFLLAFMGKLKSRPDLRFIQLLDHLAMDWPEKNEFELVYQLYSIEHDLLLAVHTRISRESPYALTMSRLWPIAQYQEREVFDLFGILYEGHPDLRRLFLEDDWVGFPLRKDYKDYFMLEMPE
ncbi:MAG: NADH-quinone oxidoreductase subunit C [Bdellovibrionales bacterium]|nr:NADH-quinone oxidoreductase subunit C [Bdellovibrionales bacterium]